MEQITVRIMDDMPVGTNGFVMEDESGDYNVYLSARLSGDALKTAYQHEMAHIQNHDLSRSKSVSRIEKDVEQNLRKR